MVIAYRCNDKDRDGGVCFGSQGSLGRLAAMSHPKAKKCLRDLCKKFNLVSYNSKPSTLKDGGVFYNTYRLNWAKMTPVIEAAVGIRSDVQRGKVGASCKAEGGSNGSQDGSNGSKGVDLMDPGGGSNRSTEYKKVSVNKVTTTTTPNSSRADMIQRLIAQRLGTPVENVWPASVTKYALDKDPAKIVECVDEIRQMRNKDRDKLAKDPELHIALLFKKIEYLPSTSNAATDESYEQAFAQPEKVETESEPPKKNWYAETKKKMLEMFQSEAGKGQCDAFVKMYQDRFSGMLTENLEKALPVFETCMDDAKKAAEKTQGGGTLSRDALQLIVADRYARYATVNVDGEWCKCTTPPVVLRPASPS